MAIPYEKPILLVDDDPIILETMSEMLCQRNYEVIQETSAPAALDIAAERELDLVFTDVSMPVMDGLEFCERLQTLRPGVLVVVMTAFGSEKIAVEAMKRGAYDYVAKPFDLEELLILVEKAITRIQLAEENRRLSQQLREFTGQAEMIGQSPPLERIREMVRRVAASDVTALITGESGTGKELVAQAIYKQSERHDRPFVTINCTALPETLLESELFGHERGSFTGAYRRQIGKFEQANGGTIFLDEIGDMSLKTQTKLLRVIQEQTFERVGGKKTLQVDVRIIAATNRNLQEEISRGSFREDLYYRLNVVELHIPPLRERAEDIPLLVHHFLEMFGEKYGRKGLAIPKDLVTRMCQHDWPGNIRQLRNWVERLVVLGPEEAEAALDPGQRPAEASEPTEELTEESFVSLAQAELQYIRKVLDFTNNNKLRAARILEIDPKTLRNKIKKFAS